MWAMCIKDMTISIFKLRFAGKVYAFVLIPPFHFDSFTVSKEFVINRNGVKIFPEEQRFVWIIVQYR